MNTDQFISQLQALYPGKPIFKNDDNNPTEILCELDPTSDHPDYSVAIAVIDRSIPHYHQHTEELYEVLTGQLTLYTCHPELVSGSQLKYQKHILHPGDSYTIKPGTYHFAEGQETWIKATSHPGWTTNDHHLIITS